MYFSGGGVVETRVANLFSVIFSGLICRLLFAVLLKLLFKLSMVSPPFFHTYVKFPYALKLIALIWFI